MTKFRSLLAASNPDKQYTEFFVFPDGLSAFRAARDIASANRFGTGYTLYASEERLKFCVSGCSGGSGGITF